MLPDCKPYPGKLRKDGYAHTTRNKKTVLAHRQAYIDTYGPIPDGMHVLHKCDNPSCVNPEHLFVGTHTDNMQDKLAKGRDQNASRTHCYQGHEYTEENTYRNGNVRYCKTCRREYDRRRRRGFNAQGTPEVHEG